MNKHLEMMKQLLYSCKTLSSKDFRKEVDKIDNHYKKMSEEEQGLYHELWCKFIKE